MRKILILIVICLGFVATSKAQTPPVCTFAQVAFNSVNNTFEYHCPNTNNWFPAQVTGGGGTVISNGLQDPGSNGIVVRTALDITTIASSADIIALFGGLCGPTTFLRGDGTCGASSQIFPVPGVAVSAGTGGPWSPSLQVGTAANNLVQLNALGQLPAVSAANLTNFPTFNQNTTGNAATANAFAATPVICANGQAPRGVITNGNATGCQSISAAVGAAIKPDNSATGPSVQYVSPTCFGGVACVDTNDGLSWGQAKATIYTAICSFNNGNCSNQQAGTGTVYVGGGTYTGVSANTNVGNTAGIWLLGSGDPNYITTPPGWLRCVQSGGGSCNITIIGVPSSGAGPNGHTNTVPVFAGNGVDNNHPSVWISGVAGVELHNMGFTGTFGGPPGRGLVIGECSNGARGGGCAVTNSYFDNVHFQLAQGVSNGPCTDITGASYWLWFTNYGCNGNAYNASGGLLSNAAAAMLLDGTGNTGIGLIHVRDSNFAGGGIKVNPGSSGAGLYADNITEEGDFVHTTPPVVRFTSFPPQTDCRVSNIQTADPGTGNPISVENDGGIPGCIVSNTLGGIIQGPATVMNQDLHTLVNETTTPLLQQQTGIFGTYLVGESDMARRISGINPARFTNLAASDNTNWAITNLAGVNTLTRNVSDPFGGTGAATASSTNATTETLFLSSGAGSCTTSYTPTAGDWIVAASWIKGNSTATNLPVVLNYCGGATPSFSGAYDMFSISNGSGSEWNWVYNARKVSGGSSTNLGVASHFSTAGTATAYGPLLYIIPAGTLSDGEVLNFLNSMNSQSTNAAVGSISNIAGHPLQLDGDAFANLGTPPNGTVTFCKDCVVANPCAGSGTGALATRLNGVWNCGGAGLQPNTLNTITSLTGTTASGTFTSGANHEYLQSALTGGSSCTANANGKTDALSACVNTPSSGVTNAWSAGLASYVTVNDPNQGGVFGKVEGVGVYPFCSAAANNTFCIGSAPQVSDVSGKTGTYLEGEEVGVVPANTTTTGVGALFSFEGGNAQPTSDNMPAIAIQTPAGSGTWTTGFECQNSSISTTKFNACLTLGKSSASLGATSQLIAWNANNGSTDIAVGLALGGDSTMQFSSNVPVDATSFATYMTATADLSLHQLVKIDTSNPDAVVVCTTGDTSCDGFVAEVVIQKCLAGGTTCPVVMGSGQRVQGILGTGTCAIGNYVIVDTTTNGRIQCQAGLPTLSKVIGKAISAQSSVGSLVDILTKFE